jgi:predicted aspartyl protease
VTSRSRYSTAYEPPAPILLARVAPPVGGHGVAVLGVVDTGADLTVIPESVAKELGLPLVSRIRVVGVTGASAAAPVRAAAIDVAGSRHLVEVACLGDDAILGRDLLNRMVIRLDGPRQSLEIGARGAKRRKKR